MNSNLKFHHIGIATKSIEKSVLMYAHLGYLSSETIVEKSQNVKICFLTKEDSPILELVEPLTAESPVSRMVAQSGSTPYHTCYEVEDIHSAVDELEDLNFRPLFEPIKSDAMWNGLICYLFADGIGLIELYQPLK